MTPPRHDTPQLQDAIADAISTATRGAGRVNILVAGKTGVGKSTLINAVFRGDLAKTGAGKPVTQTTQEFSRPGHPLTIIDTRGLEVGDYARSRQQLADLIRERAASEDQDRHLHVAWLCIQDSSHRVEDAEIELCALPDAGIPVIGVLTKARKNSPFQEQARALLPRARQVVAVRAARTHRGTGCGPAADGAGRADRSHRRLHPRIAAARLRQRALDPQPEGPGSKKSGLK
ncbi:GTPase [Achromobacter insuavis]